MERKEPTNSKRWLVIAVVMLVLVVGGAALAYNALAGRAGTGNGLVASPAGTETGADTEARDGAGTASDVALPTRHGNRRAAPALSITDEDGAAVSLSDLEGRPKVIIFWASWCHYCQQELDGVEELYATYGDKVDFIAVDCVGANGETEQMGRDYKAKAGLTFPIYFDDAAQTTADAYRVYSFPTTYFVDGDGGLVGYYPGYMQSSTLTDILDSLLAE